MTQVKICGITTPDAMTAALEGGADFVGLVFHPASPRNLDIEVAAYLANYVPAHVTVTALLVNPTESQIAKILDNVRIDMLQLHGDETPAEIAAIKARFGKSVMKALSIATPADVAAIPAYAQAADWLLLDAKGTTDLPGGTGNTFDWSLLKDFQSPKPWMLAGGLTAENVASAIRALNPTAVDVSSGVESARGIKDAAKILAFLKAAKAA